jgi:hypothetical protein
VFPATRLADDSVVLNMIRQVQANTSGASHTEIVDFMHHKGREIKKPETSFMACLSAMVVSALKGFSLQRG